MVKKKGRGGKGPRNGGGGSSSSSHDNAASAADPSYAKTKAGKKAMAARKKASKLKIADGMELLQAAHDSHDGNDLAAARSNLANAREKFQEVVDSFDGVHSTALFNLGVVSQTTAEWELSSGDNSAAKLRSSNAKLREAASFFQLAIAADTSKRGVFAGRAHAELASIILDPRAAEEGKREAGPAQLEEAIQHLHRSNEIYAATTNGEVEGTTMLQIGDCHAALMQHYLGTASNDDGGDDGVSGGCSSEIAAAQDQLRLACIAYGLEGESIISAYSMEPGSDFDFLLQKLRAIHGFVLWAVEHNFPATTSPQAVSENEVLGYISQAKACSKALVALSGSSGSGGRGGGVGQQVGGVGDATADAETECEMLMISADVYEFAAQLDGANAIALHAEAIKVLRMAETLFPESEDVQGSLGEQLFESGKIEPSGASRTTMLTAAAAAYKKALALAAPETDATSSYNLLCIRLLLCGNGECGVDGEKGDGKGNSGESSSCSSDIDIEIEKELNALLETAAIAAAAEDVDGDDGGHGGAISKDDALARVKQELREDIDLEPVFTLPVFLALTSA